MDAVLPQTQCTRCGYPDCAHYAQAVAARQAGVDQCPPGGHEGVRRIAAVVQQPVLPLNPEYGAEAPRTLAVIDEDWCIGCTLCLDACPTDAIVGASKRMHTVVAPLCTGCELCLPVCPVDCIELDNASGNATGWAAWSQEQATRARSNYQKHSNRRLSGMRKTAKNPQTLPAVEESRPAASNPSVPTPMPSKVTDDNTAPTGQTTPPDKKATIAAILAKARQQRGSAN